MAINWKKSSLDGVTHLTHLCVDVDLRCNCFKVLSRKHVAILSAIEELLAKGRCSARHFASVAGRIATLRLSVGPLTALFYRALHRDIDKALSWNSTVTFQADTIEELKFWLSNDRTEFCSPSWPTHALGSPVDLFVDASASGWGSWIAFPSRVSTGGIFSPQ